MDAASWVVVDVREMQCAQALAQANLAAKRVPAGSALELVANTADVVQDLVTWARELGHEVVSQAACDGDTRVRIRTRG